MQTDNVNSVVALLSHEGSLNGTIMACVSSPTSADQQSYVTLRLPPHHKVQGMDIQCVAMKLCHLGPKCDCLTGGCVYETVHRSMTSAEGM